MITIVFCLGRLPGLSREELQDYGLERHAPLVREHAAVLGIRRYVQSHSFDRATAASSAA
ncbi:EthD domain-containing protein [Blastomonas sp. CACIA14H2]|uniref:EthD domain-containing protein n=1 Tax=Blastomonas sp. CACIA14H2 TaxID=1419876 RepID=UPI0026D3F301